MASGGNLPERARSNSRKIPEGIEKEAVDTIVILHESPYVLCSGAGRIGYFGCP
jgi:hypothetical protein